MIAGLDLSTARTGWCSPDGEFSSITPAAGANEPARRLFEIRRALVHRIRTTPPAPLLVVVEGYSMGSPGRLSLIRLGELGGMVRCQLFELGIPYVEVAPTALKRWATGSGRAEKPEMVRAAKAITGGEWAHERFPNHDEADAVLLRAMGQAAYGLRPITRDHEPAVLAGVNWPHPAGLRPMF